jgi:hypothetical protein
VALAEGIVLDDPEDRRRLGALAARARAPGMHAVRRIAVGSRDRVILVLLGLALGGAAAASAPELPTSAPLAVEATALVPIDDESSVQILGVTGQIFVTGHDERELRVISRLPGPDGAELPVAIWQEGTKLVVGPPPGQAPRPGTLRVEVPRGFAVALDASRSEVLIAEIDGGLDVEGTELRTTVQSCGAVAADVTGGSLAVSQSRDLTLRTHDVNLSATDIAGSVNLHASGGEILLHSMAAAVEVETEGAKVVIDGAAVPVHIKAGKGTVTAKGLTGGELQLTGAPLKLQDGKGDITVTTDTTVEFLSMAAAMHFDMYGGNLRGKGNAGILEVRLRNSEVNIEGIEDGMRVQGDGIKARIVDVGGEIYVEASVSDFFIDKPASADLHVDRGSLTVQRAAGAVKAVVVGGDAHVTDGMGPVQLDLDGGEAEVSWASLSGDKDSQIVNKSGGVTLRFPPSAIGRVEAKTKFGRIDSTIATIRIMDGEKEAQGPVNNGSRPVVHVLAEQDIHILGEAAASDDQN